jgi:release factor glutamine methyltransferase
MVRRRVAGEPLEVIVGWAEFCGLRVLVAPGVFVPRQRSGFLVITAIELAGPSAVIVDLCCGTGALGMAVAAKVGGAGLYACDIDPEAVRCARRNVGDLGGQVFQGDLYDALPESLRGGVDLLIANAPYVPTEEIGLMPPEARVYEPQVALDGGPDGVAIHRRVAAGAPDWLAPGGHLLIETSQRQANQTAETASTHGLLTRILSSEEFSCTVVDAAMPS